MLNSLTPVLKLKKVWHSHLFKFPPLQLKLLGFCQLQCSAYVKSLPWNQAFFFIHVVVCFQSCVFWCENASFGVIFSFLSCNGTLCISFATWSTKQIKSISDWHVFTETTIKIRRQDKRFCSEPFPYHCTEINTRFKIFSWITGELCQLVNKKAQLRKILIKFVFCPATNATLWLIDFHFCLCSNCDGVTFYITKCHLLVPKLT